jgi:hypothetical protein
MTLGRKRGEVDPPLDARIDLLLLSRFSSVFYVIFVEENKDMLAMLIPLLTTAFQV